VGLQMQTTKRIQFFLHVKSVVYIAKIDCGKDGFDGVALSNSDADFVQSS
jgi:hypothetical protein